MWGSVALVMYLPDPLGSYLTELRQRLPGGGRPQAHITLLPPRELNFPVTEAAQEIGEALRGVEKFQLELGAVQAFPESCFVYVSIGRGHRDITQLHDSLNSGKLHARENYEYIPHVTISGPVAEGELEGSLKQANLEWRSAPYNRSFAVSEVVLLWQAADCSNKASWNRVSTFQLADGYPAPTQT